MISNPLAFNYGPTKILTVSDNCQALLGYAAENRMALVELAAESLKTSGKSLDLDPQTLLDMAMHQLQIGEIGQRLRENLSLEPLEFFKILFKKYIAILSKSWGTRYFLCRFAMEKRYDLLKHARKLLQKYFPIGAPSILSEEEVLSGTVFRVLTSKSLVFDGKNLMGFLVAVMKRFLGDEQRKLHTVKRERNHALFLDDMLGKKDNAIRPSTGLDALFEDLWQAVWAHEQCRKFLNTRLEPLPEIKGKKKGDQSTELDSWETAMIQALNAYRLTGENNALSMIQNLLHRDLKTWLDGSFYFEDGSGRWRPSETHDHVIWEIVKEFATQSEPTPIVLRDRCRREAHQRFLHDLHFQPHGIKEENTFSEAAGSRKADVGMRRLSDPGERQKIVKFMIEHYPLELGAMLTKAEGIKNREWASHLGMNKFTFYSRIEKARVALIDLLTPYLEASPKD